MKEAFAEQQTAHEHLDHKVNAKLGTMEVEVQKISELWVRHEQKAHEQQILESRISLLIAELDDLSSGVQQLAKHISVALPKKSAFKAAQSRKIVIPRGKSRLKKL